MNLVLVERRATTETQPMSCQSRMGPRRKMTWHLFLVGEDGLDFPWSIQY